jgi:hypothetical protein
MANYSDVSLNKDHERLFEWCKMLLLKANPEIEEYILCYNVECAKQISSIVEIISSRVKENRLDDEEMKLERRIKVLREEWENELLIKFNELEKKVNDLVAEKEEKMESLTKEYTRLYEWCKLFLGGR